MNLTDIIDTKCLKYGGRLTLDEARYLAANLDEIQAVPRVISKLLQSKISEEEVLKVIRAAKLLTVENWTDAIDNKRKRAILDLIVEKLPSLTESCFSSAIANENEEALCALITSPKNPFSRKWLENKAVQIGRENCVRKTYEKLGFESTSIPELTNDIVKSICTHNLFRRYGIEMIPSFFKNAVLVCKLWNKLVMELVTSVFKDNEIDLATLRIKNADQTSSFLFSFGTLLTDLNIRDLENDPIVEKIPNFCPNLKILKTRSDTLGTISQLTSLTFLSFYQSPIECPLEGLKNLTNLRTLDLSGCDQLMSIGPEIQSLTNLEELHLTHTYGETRPLPDLTPLTNLQELSLGISPAYQSHPTFSKQLKALKKALPSLSITK